MGKSTILGKLFEPLGNYFKTNLSKQWASGRAKCISCGHTWNVVYLKVPGGEYKLECPKCKKRNSKIIK